MFISVFRERRGGGEEEKGNITKACQLQYLCTVVCSVYNQHTNNMTHNVVLSRSYPPPSPLLLSSQINTIYSFQLTTSSEVVVLDGYKKGVYCVLDAIFPHL